MLAYQDAILVLFLPLGGWLAYYLSKRIKHYGARVISVSLVLAFCLSFSVVSYRLPAAIPTVVGILLWVQEALAPTVTCIPSSEGCTPRLKQGGLFVVAPFLVQWLLWLLVVAVFTARKSWRGLTGSSTRPPMAARER